MAVTYEAIATNTLGSATGSVTFSSIAGTYTDLILVATGGFTTGGTSIGYQFNTDTSGSSTNYSYTYFYGSGSGTGSGRASNTYYASGAYAGSSSDKIISYAHFMNYSNTTTYKTVLNRTTATATQAAAEVSLWRNTAAINLIKISALGDTFIAGSTFTLYGLAAA